MSDKLTEADWDAIGAARQAEPVPDWVIICQTLGECSECGHRFKYGHPEKIHNLDPCPRCGSLEWVKWGYETPSGKHVPKDQIEEWDRSRKEDNNER